mgnify:CR=1 FL=1
MKSTIRYALLSACASYALWSGDVSAGGPPAIETHNPHHRVICTLLIKVREAYAGEWDVTGSLIIPDLYPFPVGAYDPPGRAGPHTLQMALRVADSHWYHSLPCSGQVGGYPSCDVVKYGPEDHPQNVYTGHGIVRCPASDGTGVGRRP